jgi:tricorn protease
MFRRRSIALAVAFASVLCCVAPLRAARAATEAAPPLLVRNPTISRTQIAFAYGGDIWIVPRAGGEATRLVTGYGLLTAPHFSPDGSTIAFSGRYDGNTDVYTVPVTGGDPRRLTFDPAADTAVGWTPDGASVLFVSNMKSPTDPNRLYTVPATGGFPVPVPLNMAETGSYSPDGTHLAYVPNFRWEPFWKGYRGGQTTPIYIADLADSHATPIPRDDSNDDSPMWVGNTVYFLSDRNGPVTLFGYDIASKAVTRLLPAEGFDITSASAGPDAIVYAKFGTLHVYDLASHASREVHVSVSADMPQRRPHWQHVGREIANANLSPTGVRAVFEAHGQILTVPAEHGDIRNISDAPHTANRDPAWSPDGKSIAYFSDVSGEYELVVRDQRALQPRRSYKLGAAPSYFYGPLWSPDSKKILYSDKHLNLWYLELDHPEPVKVATAPYDSFGPNAWDAAWSPDSRWISYVDVLPNFLHAAFLYSVPNRANHQLTDGTSDVRNPVFDASGKYVYFTASTNTGLTSNGLDMTSDEHPVSANVYAVVLGRTVESPVKPQSDDEAAAKSDEPDGDASPKPAPSPAASAAKKPRAKPETADVTIDFENISQRIVALPVPEANYAGLLPGKAGQVFLLEAPLATNTADPPDFSASVFDLATRKAMPYVAGVSSFSLSANGEKALYEQKNAWFIAPADKAADAKALDTAAMEVYVDPPAEWRQMYHEVWRIERDFFYDPRYHGLDIGAAERRFEPYLAGVASRDDLTFLFQEMLSYLSVGHMFVRGGSEPPMPQTNVGLLGADYAIENGRYRFAKIYDGENWNPELQAPLTQPGSDVRVGDYLLAVNAHELKADDNLYAFFGETAGRQITIRVGPNADGRGARDVTVVPVANEFGLRNRDWIESNRRKVDELSGGKLAYVYVPDTEYDGFTSFNRYFFSQVGKEGVIVDERFNHGGQIADYMIEYLSRKPQSLLAGRDGKMTLDPPLAIYGPKVMLINQFSGSGGDALPWYFRKAGLGPLVGVRTWGGLVGIGGYPTLIDGGTVTAPRLAIGGLHGQWEVEGHGIPPDITVWDDPRAERTGHDPQLEAAVAKAMELLREHPLPVYKKPPPIDHHPVLPGNE